MGPDAPGPPPFGYPAATTMEPGEGAAVGASAAARPGEGATWPGEYAAGVTGHPEGAAVGASGGGRGLPPPPSDALAAAARSRAAVAAEAHHTRLGQLMPEAHALLCVLEERLEEEESVRMAAEVAEEVAEEVVRACKEPGAEGEGRLGWPLGVERALSGAGAAGGAQAAGRQ